MYVGNADKRCENEGTESPSWDRSSSTERENVLMTGVGGRPWRILRDLPHCQRFPKPLHKTSPDPDTATHPLAFGGVTQGPLEMLLVVLIQKLVPELLGQRLLSGGGLLLAVVFFH